MKIRHFTSTSSSPFGLQMTPMIDIVFQLLVFFILTFRIVAMEGDFNVKMPLVTPREGMPDDVQLPPMKLRISADPQGDLGSIMLNNRSIRDWRHLRTEIVGIIGDDRGPDSLQESAEIELDVDYELRYKHVVNAITAVSGYKERGEVIKLVENIKFAAPRPPSGQ